VVWRELDEGDEGWDTAYGHYSVTGNRLTIVLKAGDEVEIEVLTFSIVGNKLIITDEDGDTYVYTKK